MKNDKDPTPLDLVRDPEFRSWVYNGTSTFDWDAWVRLEQTRISTVEVARNILLSIVSDVRDPSSPDVQSGVRLIVSELNKKNDAEGTRHSGLRRGWAPWFKWSAVAACVLFVIGIGVFYEGGSNYNESSSQPYSFERVDTFSGEVVSVKNETKTPKLVDLPDGSSLLLKEASSVHFPKTFSTEKREVSLYGEAFFEVQKNPEVPFFVYAGGLTARVVGTSFTASAFEDASFVRVKTGKVSVYRTAKTGGNSRKEQEILLLPDQQAMLSSFDPEIVFKERKEIPVARLAPIETLNFVFKRTPVAKVFRELEEAYNIKIHYQPQKMDGCTVTASLGDDPLREKLDILCEILSAVYTIEADGIHITAPGCK